MKTIAERLAELGHECGQEFRKSADPIHLERLEVVGEDADWETVANALEPGEILRCSSTADDCWAEICGDDIAAVERKHPEFVKGFLEGARSED